MKQTLFLLSLFGLFTACSNTPPVKPEGKNVEVSRKKADDSCQEIGTVEGRATHHTDSFEDALKDLKNDAALKGANYVHIKQSGAMGQAVRGTAYLCE